MEKLNVNSFMNGYFPSNKMEPNGANRIDKNIDIDNNKFNYVLNDNGVAFWAEGALVFDCPKERMKQDPEAGIKALTLLESVWKERMKGK